MDKLEQSCLPGYEYVIAHLYDKYRRNLTISTVSQTGQTLNSFLFFLQEVRSAQLESICRKDIAAYVDHEQERGLKVNSVRNHSKTVYTIPPEDLEQIPAALTSTRDRALILLLLHTGMRIGELLQVKMTDIILQERNILLFIGAKNFHGRVMYYSREAEPTLNKWLAERKSDDPALQQVIEPKNTARLFQGYGSGDEKDINTSTGMKN